MYGSVESTSKCKNIIILHLLVDSTLNFLKRNCENVWICI